DTFIIHAGDVPAGQTEIINGGAGSLHKGGFDFDPRAGVPPPLPGADPGTPGVHQVVEGEGVEINLCGHRQGGQGGACDDSNNENGDGCDNNCKFTGCGNRIVDPGEECDDGNKVNGDGCDNNCKFTGCGNGIVDPGEQCDDGNTVNGDGCSSTCQSTC